MPDLPTLIILAESDCHQRAASARRALPTGTPDVMAQLDSLHHTIRKGLASGLQVVLVATPMVAAQAHHLLPPDRVVLLPDAPPTEAGTLGDQLALGVAIAVIASARSTGWLLLPGDMPLLRTETLRVMGQAVRHNPLVYPEYRHRRGHPIGFSSEFYSELIRLQRERDVQRLLAKYPARGMEVDDAGILMTQDSHHDLTSLRAVLLGNVALGAQRLNPEA